jgi:hypothetical protein
LEVHECSVSCKGTIPDPSPDEPSTTSD